MMGVACGGGAGEEGRSGGRTGEGGGGSSDCGSGRGSESGGVVGLRRRWRWVLNISKKVTVT